MYITIDGKPLRLDFQYDWLDPEPWSDRRDPVQVAKRRITTCSIHTTEIHALPLIAGSATRYYLDPDDKEIARVQALTRALEYAKELGLFSKEQRRQVWSAYLNRFPPIVEEE